MLMEDCAASACAHALPVRRAFVGLFLYLNRLVGLVCGRSGCIGHIRTPPMFRGGAGIGLRCASSVEFEPTRPAHRA